MKPKAMDLISSLFRKWLLGWRLLGRAFLAVWIFSFLLLPFKVLCAIPICAEFFSHDTPSSMAVRFALALFLIVVYLPLAFYVAVSYMGFCPRDLLLDHTSRSKIGQNTPWSLSVRYGLIGLFIFFAMWSVLQWNKSPAGFWGNARHSDRSNPKT